MTAAMAHSVLIAVSVRPDQLCVFVHLFLTLKSNFSNFPLLDGNANVSDRSIVKIPEKVVW